LAVNLSVTVRRQTDDRRNYRQIGQFQANGGHFKKWLPRAKPPWDLVQTSGLLWVGLTNIQPTMSAIPPWVQQAL